MLNEYLKTNNKEKCCGCNACVLSCPKNCLTINNDSEGFNYPVFIDKSQCIECGICLKVCPMTINSNKNEINSFYGIVNKNTELLLKSSSGGVFGEIANVFLKNNGIVYGVALENNVAKYVRVDDLNSLNSLLGSKYIQAEANNIYQQIKIDLNNNLNVLISGTPCFISGLNKFLDKKYINLLTIDLICHGVPSQKLFDKYINWLEKNKKGKVKDFQFRNKSIFGWGISATYKVNNRIYSELTTVSPYLWAYLKNYIHRPSCYKCPYTNISRPSDITIGDFWDMDKADCNLDYKNGISLIKINTNKGLNLFINIKDKFLYQEVSADKTIKTNMALYQPAPYMKKRDYIYNNIDNISFGIIVKKYFNMPNKFLILLKNICPDNIKNLFRK